MDCSENLPIDVRKKVNKSIIAISRYLVPINYVGSDVFEHDPSLAVGMQPIPALASIDKISELEKDTHEFYLLRTSINRQINKVNYLLKQAVKETEKLLFITKGREEHVGN